MSLRGQIEALDTLAGGKGVGLQAKVVEFHRAMGVPIGDVPHVPSDERVRLRARLVIEEALELVAAMFRGVEAGELFRCARADLEEIIDSAPVRVDLAGTADALADIAYVVEGSNLEFGIDSGAVLDEVQRANMAKMGKCSGCWEGDERLLIYCELCHGTGRTPILRPDGKVTKPVGWSPPDIAGVLAKQGLGQ